MFKGRTVAANFQDSINQIDCDNALLGKAARVQFRKWGNLMTVIYPRMVDLEQYEDVYSWADRTSRVLKKLYRMPCHPQLNGRL